MALNFSTLVYLPTQDIFGRRIVITPIASQPDREGSYNARGIFGTRDMAIPAEDGSLISDQQTILDIRESEFAILPRQRDLIFIPREGSIPEEGQFEIVDTSTNGGGETTLVIRSVGLPRP
jgi:hypothetical protein